MGKGIETWTDVDYAQAAIDMLPGTVEEIKAFMPAQKVSNRWVGCLCPIDQWVNKWTDSGCWTTHTGVGTHTGYVHLPIPVREYIDWVDGIGSL